MWNMIGVTKGANENSFADISHYGVAWVEMHMSYVYFGFGRKPGYSPTWKDAGYWLGGQDKPVNGWGNRVPDGTHPMDAFTAPKSWGGDTAVLPQKAFVFGIHMKDAMCPNYAIDKAEQVGDGYFEPNSWRFGARNRCFWKTPFCGQQCDCQTRLFFHYK